MKVLLFLTYSLNLKLLFAEKTSSFEIILLRLISFQNYFDWSPCQNFKYLLKKLYPRIMIKKSEKKKLKIIKFLY